MDFYCQFSNKTNIFNYIAKDTFKEMILMASREQLRKIALYCDEYTTKSKDRLTLQNSSEKLHESCINCIHYNEKGLCDLDLVDKGLSSMSMEQDFKS